jgi:ElaA protein
MVPVKRDSQLDAQGDILWEIKKFKELTATELYEQLRLRVDVFVVEQACHYPELDGKDIHGDTIHLALRMADHTLAAYLRILAPGVSYPGVSFGRVVTAKAFRGRGLSHAMIEKAIGLAKETWSGVPIHIGAQKYLRAFYQSHGFIAISDIYIEDGIPHIDMARKQT